MAEIPHAVLSEQLEAHLEARRLHTAVFLTFTFDPGFFELQVLPVFLDIPVSHADVIRRVQLEEALLSLPGDIAVYYDANGLISGGDGSARLDVRRVPISHHTGVFHPKNVFLLLESAEPDEEDYREKTLVVASLSANLTRAGWWENVECCHVEELAEGDSSRLRDDLVSFLESLRRRVAVAHDQRGIREILGFLRGLEPRQRRSSRGSLHTHFFGGSQSLPDFLDEVAGDFIRGAYLEIISPYFDDAPTCAPLEELIERFEPKEVRVFLPRSGAGEALCRADLFESVRALPSVAWGHLPKDLLRISRHDEAGARSVHAKLYRFFTQNPKREISFVGSANLTRAAHQPGGNVESGFLVDWVPPRRPGFWLSVDSGKPSAFDTRHEDEAAAASGGSRLRLTYHWDRAIAEAYWDGPSESPALRLTARGVTAGELSALPCREWLQVPAEISTYIAELLAETSLFEVHGERETPVLLLVQEEGMSHKPSLLFQLSAADILRYWALLTPAQRAAFLEARAPEAALAGPGADLVARARAALTTDTLFDRFAGMFHAFGCLERTVSSAVKSGKEKEANYRLFGRKYDSLGSLLDRIGADGAVGDDVDRYVILLCARQLAREVARRYPEYWAEHREDAAALERRFEAAAAIRERLVEQDPARLAPFLDWFDRWFVRRAEPVMEVEA
ncbi:MAG: hypothetical protein AB7R55_04005 [Gemmatimonadales bacterium]